MKELIFEIPDELLDHTAVVVHVKSGKELIRCKDCKNFDASRQACWFNEWSRNPFGYCDRAERKEE